MGVGPERFKFAGDRASVPVSGDSAQRAVDYFKSWLPLVNQIYAQQLQQELDKQDRAVRTELERAIRRREEAIQINTRLKV